MIQLDFLDGKMAGHSCLARRFPFRVGRSPSSDLVLEDGGVWDHHLEIDLAPPEGVLVSAKPGALLAVNGESIERAILANGDVITLGAVKIRFGLSPTKQRLHRFREFLTWTLLYMLVVAQLALIYLLAW